MTSKPYMIICKKCASQTSSLWTFCPYCGTRIIGNRVSKKMKLIKKIIIVLGIFFILPAIFTIIGYSVGKFSIPNNDLFYGYLILLKTFYLIPIVIIGIIVGVYFLRKK